MADIINLRQKRKEQARSSKQKQAEENRARFGRTKSEKKKRTWEKDKLKSHLDGHKRDSKK